MFPKNHPQRIRQGGHTKAGRSLLQDPEKTKGRPFRKAETREFAKTRPKKTREKTAKTVLETPKHQKHPKTMFENPPKTWQQGKTTTKTTTHNHPNRTQVLVLHVVPGPGGFRNSPPWGQQRMPKWIRDTHAAGLDFCVFLEQNKKYKKYTTVKTNQKKILAKPQMSSSKGHKRHSLFHGKMIHAIFPPDMSNPLEKKNSTQARLLFQSQPFSVPFSLPLGRIASEPVGKSG